jgi:Na+/proline symporter
MNGFSVILIILSLFTGVAIAVAGTYFSKKKMANKEAYFTAGRNISTGFMTASFIAYAVGTGLIFSPGEMAYLSGVTAMIGYALAISTAYLVFIPISKKIKTLIPQGHTIGEYTKIRYGTFMYVVSLAVSIIYMFILFVSNMIGAAIMFKYVAGVPMILSVTVVGIPTIYFAAFGGVGAAIFTSGLQSLLITPLLFIPALLCLFDVGGVSRIYGHLLDVSPNFLQIFDKGGVEFGVMIIIAVTAAELLNQTLWQRIYTADNHKTVQKSLLSAAIMIFPMTIIAASLGLFSAGLGIEVPHTSIASGMAISQVLPSWGVLLFCLVVVVASSSTGGDALSGFASIISIDIARPLVKNLSGDRAVVIGRISAILIGLAGLAVAYFEPSVLKTLLLADLLASAAVVPTLLGLYTKKANGIGAAAATLCGIAIGMPFYIQGASLPSFGLALIVSTVVILVSMIFSKSGFDYDRLRNEITAI